MDNTKMDLKETGYGGVDWVHLAQVTAHGGIEQKTQKT
jgi:hypothetical protein